MKNRTPYFFLVLAVTAGLIGWWAWPPKAASPAATPAKVEPPSPAAEPTPPPPVAAPAETPAVVHQTAAPAVQARAQQFRQALDAENANPINYYGKVVDQYVEPVRGAKIVGNVLLNVGFERSRYETFTATTNDAGLFQFTNLHGVNLGLSITKSGYEIGRYDRASNGSDKGLHSTSSDRVIFTMWKLGGAEPMVHTQLDSRVPYDGSAATFDLLAGKKSSAGELRVALTRTPAQVKRGVDRFDWNVRLEMAGGGLAETADAYQYLAPDAGYQTALVFAQSKNDTKWTQRLTKTFYLRTAKGQYGRVLIDLTMDSERADTGISVETWLTPSGSRNLEFDESKQIKP